MKWYKGNIHTHTTNSDGDSSPDHVASWYKDNQYDFLVLSDHNHLTILEESKTDVDKWPLLVPGEEITIREINGKPAALHINGIGIKELITPGVYESNIDGINDVVDKVNMQGGLASINHPNYQWWVSSDDMWSRYCWKYLRYLKRIWFRSPPFSYLKESTILPLPEISKMSTSSRMFGWPRRSTRAEISLRMK